MKAIILAAGRGSRMGAATEAQPKCLTLLGGRALLDLQRSALSGGGVAEQAVVTGYLSHLLDRQQLTTFHNARWAETNMVRSLQCASPWLSAHTCIVSYSDIFYPVETVRALAGSAGDIAIAYDRDWRDLWNARFADPLLDAETFRLKSDGTLAEIGARATDIKEVQGQYMGLLKFTPRGFAIVSNHLSGLNDDLVDKLDMTSLLSRLLRAGVSINTVATAPGWGEVDSRSDVTLYEQWLQEKKLTLATYPT